MQGLHMMREQIHSARAVPAGAGANDKLPDLYWLGPFPLPAEGPMTHA
jgi:hypothetical protein